MTTYSQHNYFLQLRVLHVEDDVHIAGTVLRLFRHVPYAKVVLSNVPSLGEALVSLRDHVWDCVLPDLTLPDSSGIATFHQVHGFTDVPIVVLTAEENLDRRAETIAAFEDEGLFLIGLAHLPSDTGMDGNA